MERNRLVASLLVLAVVSKLIAGEALASESLPERSPQTQSPAYEPTFPELPGTELPAIVYDDLGLRRLPPVGPLKPDHSVRAASAEMVLPAPQPTEVVPAPAAETPLDASADVEVEPPVDPIVWEGSVELGLNGSEGNSETLNLRAGARGKRNGPFTTFTVDVNYKRDSKRDNNGWAETANRLFFDWRNEWLLEDSPWSLFVHGTVEFDEFQAFDARVTLDSGVGYEFVKTDATSLVGRFGAGFSREVGGPDDRWVPEALFGLDYKHSFTKRQSLTASTEYFPDWTNFGDFRLNSKVHWKIDIDDESNLSLKVGIIDRYDSTPHGAEPNDLDYSVMLLWSF